MSTLDAPQAVPTASPEHVLVTKLFYDGLQDRIKELEQENDSLKKQAAKDPVYEKVNGKAQTTFPTHPEYDFKTFNQAGPLNEAIRRDGRKVVHFEFVDKDTLGVVFEVPRQDTPPTPEQPSAAVSATPPQEPLKGEIVGINDEQSDELETELAKARHGQVDVWLAEKAAEREIVKRNAVMTTYNFLRQQTLQHVVFGGD